MQNLPALHAENLAVSLGGARILNGVHLTVNPGDIYGLLGRNGAGKTTTMRCLLGLLPFQGGRSEVFGISSKRIHRVPRQIGVALDPPGLDDSLSVRQNLELARLREGCRHGRTVDDVLELVKLGHRQHNRGDRLSHGQGRRAAVARALLGHPELLVLDEPLSGLDPEGVEDLLELFRELGQEGITVVLSSHHLREVQDVCNRVGLIEGGEVILEGETRQLLADAGECLIVECRDGEAGQRVLESSPLVQEVERLDKGRYQARVEPGAHLAALARQLAEADVGLEEFRRERASLVDVFRKAVAS